MQDTQGLWAETKLPLPTNVRIREQEHWNVVVKKQIRKGKKTCNEPVTIDGWTGAFVLNPKKRHMKVDTDLVTVCGSSEERQRRSSFPLDTDFAVPKHEARKRARESRGKHTEPKYDPIMHEAPPDWLLNALLQLKQDSFEPKSKPTADTKPADIQTSSDMPAQTGKLEIMKNELHVPVFAGLHDSVGPYNKECIPIAPSLYTQTHTTPMVAMSYANYPSHPVNYACKCSSCLAAMIPVPYAYGPM